MRIGLSVCVLLIAGSASAFGTPYVKIDEECSTFAGRCLKTIAVCTYVGIQGRKVLIPHWEPDKEQVCPPILLLPFDLPG